MVKAKDQVGSLVFFIWIHPGDLKKEKSLHRFVQWISMKSTIQIWTVIKRATPRIRGVLIKKEYYFFCFYYKIILNKFVKLLNGVKE